MKLGGWLKRYRKQTLRLSQQQVAWKVDLSDVGYQNIERGTRRPSVAVFERMISALDLPAHIQRTGWEEIAKSQLDPEILKHINISWKDPHQE